MNCLKCGCPLTEGARFCTNCGCPVTYNGSENTNTMPYYTNQPYPIYAKPKSGRKLPNWAVAVIIITIVLFMGGVIVSLSFGTYEIVQEITSKTEDTNLVYSTVNYANNGDVLNFARCFKDYIGYTDEEIMEEIDDYLNETDGAELCLGALKEFIFDNRVDEYLDLDKINGVSSIKVIDVDSYDLQDKKGLVVATFGISDAYGNYLAVDAYVNMVKIENKWYIEY